MEMTVNRQLAAIKQRYTQECDRNVRRQQTFFVTRMALAALVKKDAKPLWDIRITNWCNRAAEPYKMLEVWEDTSKTDQDEILNKVLIDRGNQVIRRSDESTDGSEERTKGNDKPEIENRQQQQDTKTKNTTERSVQKYEVDRIFHHVNRINGTNYIVRWYRYTPAGDADVMEELARHILKHIFEEYRSWKERTIDNKDRIANEENVVFCDKEKSYITVEERHETKEKGWGRLNVIDEVPCSCKETNATHSFETGGKTRPSGRRRRAF